MKITDIQKQKKNSSRYSVFIDKAFAFGLEDIDIYNFHLKVGDEISKEKYDLIIETSVFSSAKNTALRFLGYKARTEKEIYKKLSKQEYPEQIIKKTIKFLKSYNYINDEKYALAYIKDGFSLKGLGLKRLAYELKIKGVDTAITEKAMQSFKNKINEKDKAAELLRKKLKNELKTGLKPDYKLKQRLYGFLSRKGYSYSDIKYAFNKVLQEDF